LSILALALVASLAVVPAQGVRVSPPALKIGLRGSQGPISVPGLPRNVPDVQDSRKLNVGMPAAGWDAVAACESRGDWSTNTGNGFWGGLQFAPSTWFAYGGGPFDGSGPFPYSREAQVAVAERVLVAQGPGAWPHCWP
jgi:Transglycosylase-like domain